MLATIPLYYHFTKEESNKPRKRRLGFRLEKIKDYELRRLRTLAGMSREEFIDLSQASESLTFI